MEIRIFEGSTAWETIIGDYSLRIRRNGPVIYVELRENDYLCKNAWSHTKDIIEKRTGKFVTIMALGGSGSPENYYRTQELLDEVFQSVENQLKGVL